MSEFLKRFLRKSSAVDQPPSAEPDLSKLDIFERYHERLKQLSPEIQERLITPMVVFGYWNTMFYRTSYLAPFITSVYPEGRGLGINNGIMRDYNNTSPDWIIDARGRTDYLSHNPSPKELDSGGWKIEDIVPHEPTPADLLRQRQVDERDTRVFPENKGNMIAVLDVPTVRADGERGGFSIHVFKNTFAVVQQNDGIQEKRGTRHIKRAGRRFPFPR